MASASDTPAPAPAPTHASAQPLGHNVYYVRVHALPGDLPASAVQHKGSLVLDLRFVPAGDDAAEAFVAWLKFQANPASPVIVLINARTSSALLVALDDDDTPAGVVTIGPNDTSVKPDIPLHVTADTDRQAYDAFEHGVALAELITPRLDKARHDEATMNKERASGSTGESEEEDEFLPPAKGAPALVTPAAPPPAPVDAVLQRALQLHRALVALKKVE